MARNNNESKRVAIAQKAAAPARPTLGSTTNLEREDGENIAKFIGIRWDLKANLLMMVL